MKNIFNCFGSGIIGGGEKLISRTAFTNPTTGQDYIVPIGAVWIYVKAWGAAGGAIKKEAQIATPLSPNLGGNGGYCASAIPVTAEETLIIRVGLGGGGSVTPPDSNNGGRGVNGEGGGGGGYSGAFRSSTALMIAGGGGGSGAGNGGGSGGHPNGQSAGGLGSNPGNGGTQSSGGSGGGAGGNTGAALAGASGSSLNGGRGGEGTDGSGGGGGGGFFGGGGGGGFHDFGFDNGGVGGSGGGGGSTFFNFAGSDFTEGVNSFLTSSAASLIAPKNTDIDYVSGRAVGGVTPTTSSAQFGTNGGNGLVVVYAYRTKPSLEELP